MSAFTPSIKKVIKPRDIKYIKIKTKRIPSGPIVAGVVACSSANKMTAATKEIDTIILPNMLSLYTHSKQKSE